MSGTAGRRAAEGSQPAERMSLAWWVAVLCAGGLLVAVSVAYDPALVGSYYVPRFALLYPLTLTVVVLAIIHQRRARESAGLDLLDLLVLAFAAWQALSAVLSPSPVLAWFGYYNRGTGALFSMALALLFVAARRLLDHPRGRQALTWFASAVLLCRIRRWRRSRGPRTPGGAVVNGRIAGPTGNPITLAGLRACGVWLAVGLPCWPRRSATQLLAAAGALGGAVCLVLTVSRAAYLGVAVRGVRVSLPWLGSWIADGEP